MGDFETNGAQRTRGDAHETRPCAPLWKTSPARDGNGGVPAVVFMGSSGAFFSCGRWPLLASKSAARGPAAAAGV